MLKLLDIDYKILDAIINVDDPIKQGMIQIDNVKYSYIRKRINIMNRLQLLRKKPNLKDMRSIFIIPTEKGSLVYESKE